MKKLALFLVLLSILSFGVIKDVPKSHWAYDAVVSLVKLGIISGYPDKTFRGSETVTRYQLAVSLYRTIIYLKRYISNSIPKTSILEKKVSEMSDMVSKAYKWSSENYADISDINKKLSSISEKIRAAEEAGNLYDEIASLKSETLEKLMKLDKDYRAHMNNLNGKVNFLENSIKDLNTRLNLVEAKLSDLSESSQTVTEDEVEQFEKNVNDRINEIASEVTLLEIRFQENIDSLGKISKENSHVVNGLDSRLRAVEDELENLKKSEKDLKAEVNYLKKNFEDAASKVLKEEVENLKEKLQNECATVNASLSANEEELKGFQEKLSLKIEKLGSDVSDLKNSVSSVKTSLKSFAKLSEKVENNSKLLLGLEGNVKNLQKETSRLNRELSRLPTGEIFYVFLSFSVLSFLISVVVIMIGIR